MRIAVTYENGQIFQHFGHTEQFKVYDVENRAVTGSQVVDTNGQGHGALAGVLRDLGVDALICGGIGAGAQEALAQAGIRLYGGVTGGADEAVRALLAAVCPPRVSACSCRCARSRRVRSIFSSQLPIFALSTAQRCAWSAARASAALSSRRRASASVSIRRSASASCSDCS